MSTGATGMAMPGMMSDAQMQELTNAAGAEFDRLFLQLMTEHHRGGLHMAQYAQEHASDERIRTLAGIMAKNQQSEITEYARTIARLGT